MGGDELGAEFRERVAGEEAVGFAGEEVVAGVVGGVAAEAQRVGLDEERARGLPDFFDGGGERLRGGGDVDRGINGEAFHAVTGGAAPKLGVGGKLLGGRRRVGVAVVLDDEDDGEREERGEVEGLVDVAGAGTAVAEECERHAPCPENLARKRSTRCNRNGGADNSGFTQTSDFEISQMHGAALATADPGCLADKLCHQGSKFGSLADRMTVTTVITGHIIDL